MEKILILDFGGQYNQLIARRVREQHVYAEIRPYNKVRLEEVKRYAGVIFTGGPNSVYDQSSPHFDPWSTCFGNLLRCTAHGVDGRR